MPIKYLKWITRDMLQKQPEAGFVFGDNIQRAGFGGQAKEMRGEPNAFGLVTKWTPSMHEEAFFSDAQYLDPLVRWPRLYVNYDLARIQSAIDMGWVIYAPFDGLGTGLSQLPKRAPRLYNAIVERFRTFPGEECPWPLVEGVEPMELIP